MVNIRDNLTLKACRVIADIKAGEIADVTGVRVGTVYKWERGEAFPTAPQMVNIIQLFAKKGYIVDLNYINFLVN